MASPRYYPDPGPPTVRPEVRTGFGRMMDEERMAAAGRQSMGSGMGLSPIPSAQSSLLRALHATEMQAPLGASAAGVGLCGLPCHRRGSRT